MSSIETFFESDFKSQKSDWENALIRELKMSDISSRISKRLIPGHSFPVLSLQRDHQVQLSPQLSWKKASTTYAFLDEEDIHSTLTEDLKAGVRNFFFHEMALNEKKWLKIQDLLAKHSNPEEIELFLLGKTKYESSSIKVIHEIISGKMAHDRGGHSIQELALMAKGLVDSKASQVYLGVYVGTSFFQNIAKLRSARLLAKRIFELQQKNVDLKIVALTSYEGWTLFERYSNMLRNEAAVASAYIGAADYVQSSGYNVLVELESEQKPQREDWKRSGRMARNTSHILALESMLGVVEDAAFGSYHLENLTQYFCQEAWTLMQRLIGGEDITEEISSVRDEKILRLKTRKTVLSGINDYPDAQEKVEFTTTKDSFFRLAAPFEKLRLKMQGLKKPEVFLAVFGDYAQLNARINFVKNYFEILGIKVHESGSCGKDVKKFETNLKNRTEEIIVFCAIDEDYQHLQEIGQVVKDRNCFVAGKVLFNSFKNLYVDQNVYEVLESLVTDCEGRGR